MLDHSKPFEFYAVLQKYNTPNRNGRIYPERVLKREHQYHWSFLNKEKDFHKENTERPIFFYFEDDEDAIAFKLAIGK